MSKYEAEVHFTIKGKRKLSVYATNENDAKIVAEELTIKSLEHDDDLVIHNIEVRLPKFDVEVVYGIMAKEKR